ncbi:U6 snRNA (guanine-N(2))-methyltransferase THUMPD2 [Anomaloglossus baeobatrachus]|uniref:U6 snRNA (guanine-N(2))-methyltransferase THUMPD2 n=1 Tax=Anomaloglossus baeobatrachus TaxID=238106 RepID=UPI003F4F8FD9
MGGHESGREFFCTAGRGMERFVTYEAVSKLSAAQVESLPGKVFFKGNPDLCALKRVKSAERIFLLLHKGPPLTEYKGNVFSALRKLVLEEPSMWLDKLRVWETFQEKLPPRETSHGQDKAWKRKSNNDLIETKPKICKEETGVKESGALEQTAPDPVTLILPAHPPTVHDAEPVTQRLPAHPPTVHDAEPVTQILPAYPSVGHSAEPVTFRVSCRCSGVCSRTMTAQDVSRIIGVSLSKQFGWKPDLRHPRLEIFVHLSDLYSVVGFPILRQPLSNRDYIQRAGLRATTAWAMASMAEIGTAKYVLDPMCGVGTILLEAAMEWPGAIFLGIDNSESQLKVAVENVQKAGVTGSVAFLRGSVLALPLLAESVDVVVSDIPFGRKFMCSKDIKELLPDIIHQMERVLRVGGVLVLLLSQTLHYHLKTKYTFKSNESENLQNRRSEASSQCGSEDSEVDGKIAARNLDFPSLTRVESHPVSLGATEAVIFKCKKTSRAGVL